MHVILELYSYQIPSMIEKSDHLTGLLLPGSIKPNWSGFYSSLPPVNAISYFDIDALRCINNLRGFEESKIPDGIRIQVEVDDIYRFLYPQYNRPQPDDNTVSLYEPFSVEINLPMFKQE